MPTTVLASDPTGLFVFIVAIPLVVLSFISLITSFFTAIGGMAFSILLLLFHLVIFIWGYDVGYLDSAGGWVLGSFALVVASFLIALRNTRKQSNDSTAAKNQNPG